MGPEQGKSSGRMSTFSLWTGLLWDGISSIPDETVILLWLGCLWEQGIPQEGEDDCWVGAAMVLHIATPRKE